MISRPVYHGLDVGNYGNGTVRNVIISYGSLTVPAGDMHRTLPPTHSTLISESWSVAVPEEAIIKWTSDNGRAYEIVAPMRSLVGDLDSFHGFQFLFIDDHVDIYVLHRKKTNSKFLDVERSKAFSSSQSSAEHGD
jgi:hypothetical protein